MKNSKLLIITSFVIIGTLSIGCKDSADKVEEAQEEVIIANENLMNENEAYLEEIEAYKLKNAEEIANNEKSLTDFNKRIAVQKNVAKKEYEKKITFLNNQNTDLKKKMDDFKSDSKENWETFEAQFNIEMEKLRADIRELTANN
jgi:hypothetical protein